MDMFAYSRRLQTTRDETREELKLALDSTSGDALSPESLEPFIVETVRRLAPVFSLMTVIVADSKTHEFNKRTALPSATFEGENATTVASNSTYERISEPLKIFRGKGGVTGFQQAASKKFVNSFAKELEGQAKSMAWAIEFGLLWGNKTSDPYQFDGFDTKITTNRLDKNAVITLRHLDDLIDKIQEAGILDHRTLAFVASPTMISKISTLQSEARKAVVNVEFPGGLVMTTYREIPLIRSSFVRPTSTFGVLTTASSATAGALTPGATYTYRIAAVTTRGEQWASTSTAQLLAGGQSSADLTWVAVADAQLYKVYRTAANGAAGTELLRATIAAKTYDGNGTITAAVTAYNDGVVALGTDYPLDATNVDEIIFLLNFDQSEGAEIASLINDFGEEIQNMIQYLPLGISSDKTEFLLISYMAMLYKDDQVHGMLRRVRTL